MALVVSSQILQFLGLSSCFSGIECQQKIRATRSNAEFKPNEPENLQCTDQVKLKGSDDSKSDDADLPLLFRTNEEPAKIACTHQESSTIREKYLMKYDEYEKIYQYKLKVFQSINSPNKCILKYKLTDEEKGQYIGNHRKLMQTYNFSKDKIDCLKRFEFRFAKKKLESNGAYYMMKSYRYTTKGQARKAMRILCAWTAMKRIGIIEGGDIYHDEVNHNVRLVMKLWNSCLEIYMVKHDGDNNMFRKTQNIALFMRDIVKQLKLIHDHGMVFCDIKPSNICMVYDENTNIPVKFGLIDYEMVKINPCKYREEFGTQCYRPSEAQKYKDYGIFVTDKWDVFSLGITLLELMNGKHPYIDDLFLWNKELEHFDSDKIHFDKLDLHLFMDQNILDKAIETNAVLSEYGEEEFYIQLKDLIMNMINDDFGKRYNINDVIQHPWYQNYCNDFVSNV